MIHHAHSGTSGEIKSPKLADEFAEFATLEIERDVRNATVLVAFLFVPDLRAQKRLLSALNGRF
jgi:hypothetical protein